MTRKVKLEMFAHLYAENGRYLTTYQWTQHQLDGSWECKKQLPGINRWTRQPARDASTNIELQVQIQFLVDRGEHFYHA